MTHYVDRLDAAVSVLVTHGPIKQRLIRAYENNLEIVEDDDLPVEVQKSFRELRCLMHGVAPANGEGPICASVRKMSTVEADECAQLILEIHGEVIRHSDSTRTLLPLAAKDRSSVPPFLIKSN